jgi:glycerophosphoryl diester phosphodiesterase
VARRNRFLERLKSRGARPLVIAHRGDSFFAPENTLEAARSARGTGDAWELDVQLTRDGVPVVLHDDSLIRTTDISTRFGDDPRARGGFLISDFDVDEIAGLDAGSWFVSGTRLARSARDFGTLARIDPGNRSVYESGAVRIPRLVDALRLTLELDWLVNVEIKAVPLDPPGLAAAVLDAIAETETADRVLISSFDHRIVASLVDSNPDPRLAFGVLMDTPLARLPRYVSEIVGASTVHLSAECLGSGSIGYRRRPDETALRAREVEALSARGVPVLVYTVNEHGPSSLASRLAGIGVSGLFTDDPRGMTHSFDAEPAPG